MSDFDFRGGSVATPYSVTVLQEVASTQDRARDNAFEGGTAIVLAHRQTRGRGRTGARWATAPRAIAASVAFPLRADPPSAMPLVAGVAARRVLGEGVSLKWPNDVLVGDDKVAGILVEAHDGLAVAGLGINLWWPDAPAGFAALHEADPGTLPGPKLGREWAETFLSLVREPDWPRAEYVASCSTLGLDIVWEPDGRGRAIDIGPDGSLLVVTPSGERSLTSGAVRHLHPG